METHKVQIIQTVLILLVYIIVYYINKNVVNTSLKQTHIQRGRRKMIVKTIQLLSSTTVLVLLASVWGVKQGDIAVFAGTILAAIGIALFAQWSLLSNITSSVLLFFNHPMRIGDRIKVLDKDFPHEGMIADLTYFFVHIRTDEGEIVTIPNSLIFQKSIVVVQNEEV
ncbi:mechanosensitive ion channel domain-containing protein [Pelobium manganitolerans]|uniref:mechanosensitive ion channel domain-containing protein n=1 Tax=Pelobium manganitolerans TaxID=1842495 RepID=UPI003FA3D45E